jgi:AcrR family transcriptional regulator
MSRPSRNIDQALLHSGRALFPQHGCAGLSVRLVCQHAGVNTGMFHYHFQSKDDFLAQVLQGLYDEVFAQLQARAASDDTPLVRLRQALILMAGLVRAHGAWIGRLWVDAGSGEAVARQFMQRNAPRHMELLMALAQEAVANGSLAPLPPLQRFAFLMGSVLAPMLLVPAMLRIDVLPAVLVDQAQFDILSDVAIASRVDRALAALQTLAPFAKESSP